MLRTCAGAGPKWEEKRRDLRMDQAVAGVKGAGQIIATPAFP